MTRWCFIVAVFAVQAFANGRPDCMRQCATTLKAFEKQCKETTQGNKDGMTGCMLSAKEFETQCKTMCQTGAKPGRPRRN